MEIEERIESLARALGFHLVGIADPAPSERTRFIHEWVSRGYAASMDYIGRRADEREDPARLMPGVRSVIAVGFVYDRDDDHGAGARIARYAGGEDYHEVLIEPLRALASAIEAARGKPFAWRAYVDTGPVLEREFAARAGLGWIGKNTCLIHPRLGSYVFLGVLLTDLPLSPAEPEPDHCGSCRACLDACPTDAFPEPYVIDAARCLSYTTIENRGSTPEELRAPQGSWVFGCDICQEVCPWNRRRLRRLPDDPLGLRARLEPRADWREPTLAWLLGLDEDAWRDVTRGTALRRSKWRGLLRNALIAAGNSGDGGLRDAVAAHLDSADPVIAEHARWAANRLRDAAPPD